MWTKRICYSLKYALSMKRFIWISAVGRGPSLPAVKTKPEGDKSPHFLVPCCEMTKVHDKPKIVCPDIIQPSVVIIGAGIAGLSAAKRLFEAGMCDVTIVEAKNRPGGRVAFSKIGETYLEYGAETVEGACIANPIFNLATLECLLAKTKTPRNDYFLTSEGKTFLEHKEAKRLMRQFLADASGFFNRRNFNDISLGEYLNEKVEEALPKHGSFQQRHLMKMAFSGMLNSIRSRFGEDLKAISLKNFGSFIEIPGGRLRMTKGTFTLVESLMKNIPEEKIHYNKCVQSIRYSYTSVDSPRALIKCCDGHDFLADYVICTIPLGALKAFTEMLFLPQLPFEKIEAIGKIGYGHLTKVFVEYERPFWSKGEQMAITMAWDEDGKDNIPEWIGGITSIEEVPGKQSIIKVTIAGKESILVEQSSEDCIAEELTEFLRRVTGDAALPCPKDIIVTCWNKDLSFLGARSYLGLGSSVKDQCVLASPLPGPHIEGPPVLLFAGEATSPGYFGTMHGARTSGIREADRIIDITNELKGPPKKAFNEPMTPYKPPEMIPACYCAPEPVKKEEVEEKLPEPGPIPCCRCKKCHET